MWKSSILKCLCLSGYKISSIEKLGLWGGELKRGLLTIPLNSVVACGDAFQLQVR